MATQKITDGQERVRLYPPKQQANVDEINSKETPAGAQAKANVAETQAVDTANVYTDQQVATARGYTDRRVADVVAAENYRFADPIDWASATEYQPRTVVRRTGGYYVATQVTTGDDPALGLPWLALPEAVDADHRSAVDPHGPQFAAIEQVVFVEAYRDAGFTDLQTLNAAIAALTAGDVLSLEQGRTYTIGGTASIITDRVTVRGNGATITQTASLTTSLDMDGADGCVVQDTHFVGVGSDFTNASTSLGAVGLRLRNLDGARVERCTFRNHAGAGVRINNSNDVAVDRCTMVGPGATIVTAGSNYCGGVWADLVTGATTALRVTNCEISEVAQGIFTTHTCHDLRLAGNHIFDIRGQHGMYLGAADRITVANNTITGTHFLGMKIQLSGAVDIRGATVVGNVFTNCGSHGVLIEYTSTAAVATRARDVVVSGNVVRDCNPGEGVVFMRVVGGLIVGNQIRGVRTGVGLRGCHQVRVLGNHIHTAYRIGINVFEHDTVLTSDVAVVGNLVLDAGVEALLGSTYGIQIRYGSRVTIDGNHVRDTLANMEWGIFLGTGTEQETVAITNNRIAGATQQSVRILTSGGLIGGWHGNYLASPPMHSWHGGVVADQNMRFGFYGAVPRAQSIGWGDPTGAQARTTFDTATVTTAELAKRVAALISELKAYGLLAS